ncbi:unnamed protein product [Mytilus coruscus]|uniref:Uncharacterized protein n=1 Tax=Mytilus coruscus TaxID=42192 RepID=A0A6J8AH41_MYTCO|nr:unnamed protein product [Mytilus coruscus]
MQMTCRISNPNLFRIDDLLFSHQLYIAPIDCEMLLGHDFLASNNVILHIGQGYMSINDKTIKVVLGGETPSATLTVNIITMPTSIVVPPNSVMRMNCTVPVQENDFVVEPNSKTTLLIFRSVCAKGQSPVVCFMKITDNPVRLQSGFEIAEAHAVTVIESMDDPEEPSVGTCSTSRQGNSSSGTPLQKSPSWLSPDQPLQWSAHSTSGPACRACRATQVSGTGYPTSGRASGSGSTTAIIGGSGFPEYLEDGFAFDHRTYLPSRGPKISSTWKMRK